ncbi:MAG: PorT family protein [Chitinophagaceae bacterium]|nr:PorT family protein [Chitinophagaceae bacterium]
MKKVFLGLFLTTAVALGTNAQVYVQGGLNLANISKTKDGQTEKNNILPSFNVGIMGRLPITSMFSLESGLLLTGKGSKAETYFNSGNYTKAKFNPLYIEMPVNAVVKIPLQKESNVFFHAGPYVAVGIAGKSVRETSTLGVISTSTSNIKFSNDDPFTPGENEGAAYDRLKRFDVGLNFGGGVQFGRIMLKANYGLGLTKINSTESNNNADEKNKYRTLSFSVGIPLGK